MSLTITVRPNGATSGGDTKTLPDAGDNGNQEIDTKAEAEAALTHVTDDKLVAVVGTKTYTRADLINVRDAKAAPAPSSTTVPGTGASHGVGLEGYALKGVGTDGHGGGGARLTYRAGIPLSTGEHRFHLDTIFGVDAGYFSKSYTTPGGEGVKSAYTSGAGVLGGDFRYTPPIVNHSLWFALGVRVLAGVFGTAEGGTVSLPGSCAPGDFGRGECEPNAGPKTGPSGTGGGLWNGSKLNVRETSGLMLGLDIPLTIGARVVKGEWGSLDLFGGGVFSTRYLSPKDGNGLSTSGFGGFLGALVRFGGSDSVKPKPADTKPLPPPPPPPVVIADKDKDGVADADDKCPDVVGVKENFGCPALNVKVTSSPAAVKAQEKFLVGLGVSTSVKVSIKFKDEAGIMTNSNSTLIEEGNSKSEFGVPADLKSGKYKLLVTFEDTVTHVKKTEEKDIVIVENVTATLPGSFAPYQPPTIQNVKVNGLEKLEGVTYVIEGFDKDKKSIGTMDSSTVAKGDRNWTLGDKSGTRIPLAAPGGKGFQKEVNYVVALKNKEGHVVWSGSFEVGQAAPVYGKKVKPK